MAGTYSGDPQAGRLNINDVLFTRPTPFESFRSINPEYVDQEYLPISEEGDYGAAGLQPFVAHMLQRFHKTPYARLTKEPEHLKMINSWNPPPLNYSPHTDAEDMFQNMPTDTLLNSSIMQLLGGQ